jgi:hypothetical protein
MLLGRYVLGEEPLMVVKNSTASSTFYICKQKRSVATFLLRGTGKCSAGLLISCWAMLKGYRKATGKYGKGFWRVSG